MSVKYEVVSTDSINTWYVHRHKDDKVFIVAAFYGHDAKDEATKYAMLKNACLKPEEKGETG